MTNLTKIEDGNPSSQFPQQNADRIYNIDQANNVNHIVNYAPVRAKLSPTEYYNLFIIFGEKYENESFDLRNDRILQYTTTAISNRFDQFTLEDINEIISLPTLFLPEYSADTKDIKKGFLGRLVEIDKRDGNGVSKFYFQKETELDMDSVVTLQHDLRIEDLELSRTHWAIKRADLKKIVEEITNGSEIE